MRWALPSVSPPASRLSAVTPEARLAGLPDLWPGADAATVAVGLALVAFNGLRRYRRGDRPWITRDLSTGDLLNGVTLVPFCLMAASAFSDAALGELLRSDRVLLAAAGCVGAFFALGDLFRASGRPPGAD